MGTSQTSRAHSLLLQRSCRLSQPFHHEPLPVSKCAAISDPTADRGLALSQVGGLGQLGQCSRKAFLMGYPIYYYVPGVLLLGSYKLPHLGVRGPVVLRIACTALPPPAPRVESVIESAC